MGWYTDKSMYILMCTVFLDGWGCFDRVVVNICPDLGKRALGSLSFFFLKLLLFLQFGDMLESFLVEALFFCQELVFIQYKFLFIY